MRVAGIREFRNQAPQLIKGGQIVFITRHGKLSGILVPLEKPTDLPVDLRRELVDQIGTAISQHLEKTGVSEEKLLGDFEAWKKKRRSGRRRR